MAQLLLPPPLTAGQKRNSPGIVTPGKNYNRLPLVQKEGKWFRGNGALAMFPQNFTKQLLGKEFNTFGNFREKFWQLVANDENLYSHFETVNIKRMQEGKAPLAKASFNARKTISFVKDENSYVKVDNNETKLYDTGEINTESYHLHHLNPIVEGGGVYELSNLVIVAPKYHFFALHNWKNQGGVYFSNGTYIPNEKGVYKLSSDTTN